MSAQPDTERRSPLTRQRVVDAAIALADREGLDAVSMRKVGAELGVEAMSLYNHVANKDDLLDGMVDRVIAEIEAPGGDDWKVALRGRFCAAREVMMGHRWAPKVIESRTTISPVLMRYFNALLGEFRQGGFSYDLAHHAMHVLGSHALGFAQELFEPAPGAEQETDEETNATLARMAAELPFMVEMMAEIAHDGPDDTLGWCDDQTEFLFTIDLILDGLERLRDA